MFLATLMLVCADTQPAPVQPNLKLPAQVQAQPGQIFVVHAESNLKWKRWTIPSGLVRVPPEATKFGEDAFVGYGPAGVYEFKIEGTIGDQYVDGKCVVFVGNPAPVPPPGPPPPGPRPPEPRDPLVADLQKAFESDGRRSAVRDRLVRLWQDAAADVFENDERKTMADFREAMHTAAPKYPYKIEDGDLKAAREKLAGEMAALCQNNEFCPLGASKSELRGKVKALLERYSGALGQCK